MGGGEGVAMAVDLERLCRKGSGGVGGNCSQGTGAREGLVGSRRQSPRCGWEWGWELNGVGDGGGSRVG